MPAAANKISTVLQLKVISGSDANGNDIIRIQSYRGVKTTALDGDIYDVGQAIGSLKSTPVVAIMKTDSYELVNQA